MIRSFYFIAVALALVLTAIDMRADDSTAVFEQANKSYEEGKYAEAVAAYDKLVAAGDVSEALYFNRGNALFKTGQLGRSIASYRLAQYLSPRDPELRANPAIRPDLERAAALHLKQTALAGLDGRVDHE